MAGHRLAPLDHQRYGWRAHRRHVIRRGLIHVVLLLPKRAEALMERTQALIERL